MNYISLNAWAKREGVGCSRSQMMYKAGKIPGAIEEPCGKIKRIKVPEDYKLPPENLVKCMICKRELTQITLSHLTMHDMSFEDYKRMYPNAPLVGEDVKNAIREVHTGVAKTEEHKTAISKGRSGVVPKNHPRFVVGSYKASQETKDKMAAAHTGLTHTEETKRKIGDKHRGKIQPLDAIERQRKWMIEYHKNNPGFFTGKTHTADTKKAMAEAKRNWFANMTPEQKAEYSQTMSKAMTGIKRTPEQKARYSAARSKFMKENPQLFSNTKGEKEIAAWLTARNIEFAQQYQIPGHLHPYDFYLPEYHTIIEFDGAHHWLATWWLSSAATAEEREGIMLAQHDKDYDETMLALDKGYMIVRIFGKNGVDSKLHGTIEEQLIEQGMELG